MLRLKERSTVPMTQPTRQPYEVFARDYDRIAAGYQQLRTARYYDHDILRALPNFPHAILDIGCGDGALTISLAEKAPRVVAIDASPKMLTLAKTGLAERNRVLEAELPPRHLNVAFFRCFVESLNAEVARPGAYDAIVANRVLHHCEDLYAVVANLKRLLAPGGRIIVLALNATGTHRHTLWQKILMSYYVCIVLLKATARLRPRAALKDLRQEKEVYRSHAWKTHLSHEPEFRWVMLRSAMLKNGLSTSFKHRNGRFVLLVGQHSYDAPPKWFHVRYAMRVLIVAVVSMTIGWVLGRQGRLARAAEWLPLDSTAETVTLWAVETGKLLNCAWVWMGRFPLTKALAVFTFGATVGAMASRMYLRERWRTGPVEDRPGKTVRFVRWLVSVLKLDGGPAISSLWTYYRGRTNCRALAGMSECRDFLIKHFAEVEGQIWIYQSDLRGFIEERAFQDLYKSVVDVEPSIQEVRIILQEETLERLTTSDLKAIHTNLSSMERRAIIKYRTVNFKDINSIAEIPKSLQDEFKAYTSHATFIFYTKGDELPRRQAVCVNRCAVKPGQDHGLPLRIVVTAMRDWAQRLRGDERLDLEPMEKFMDVDLQRIFQDLFAGRSQFATLYSEVEQLMPRPAA